MATLFLFIIEIEMMLYHATLHGTIREGFGFLALFGSRQVSNVSRPADVSPLLTLDWGEVQPCNEYWNSPA